MIWLARLLIREKWRRALAHNGWAGCLSLGLVLAAAAAAGAVAARSLLQNAPPARISTGLNQGWCAWIAAGVLIGKDLTWRIRLERLTIYPIRGFMRLYCLGFVLSFASFPLLLLVVVLQIAGWMLPPSLAGFLCGLVSCGLLAASVQLTVSLVRAAIYQAGFVHRSARLFPILVALIIAGWMAASTVGGYGFERSLPGHQLGRILSGGEPFGPTLFLAGIVLILLIADFTVQRSAVYSGIAGPKGRFRHIMSRGSLLLIHPSWPPALWRVSLLGWIRNRNAMLLMIWGGGYGFLFMYLTKADALLDYMLFGSMVLIFHAHLRGNLLGIDHRGVWLYYMLPMPADEPLKAKNQTLSLLQACMVAAVIIPGFLHPAAGMNTAAWLSILSYAGSNILIGEISGSFFSLRHPEPIERASQFSGGMTAGALTIPLLQLLFLAAFMMSTDLSRLFLPPWALWLQLGLTPALLWFIRARVLPGWIRKTMVDERKVILAKLTVFSS